MAGTTRSTASCLFIQASILEAPFPARSWRKTGASPALGDRKKLA
jgi:hypothetical protein